MHHPRSVSLLTMPVFVLRSKQAKYCMKISLAIFLFIPHGSTARLRRIVLATTAVCSACLDFRHMICLSYASYIISFFLGEVLPFSLLSHGSPT